MPDSWADARFLVFPLGPFLAKAKSWWELFLEFGHPAARYCQYHASLPIFTQRGGLHITRVSPEVG